jgi:hypothetical protein
MRRQSRDGSSFLGANANRLAGIAAIFGLQHELLLKAIVIALRPAVIGATFEQDYFLGHLRFARTLKTSTSSARVGRGHAG